MALTPLYCLACPTIKHISHQASCVHPGQTIKHISHQAWWHLLHYICPLCTCIWKLLYDACCRVSLFLAFNSLFRQTFLHPCSNSTCPWTLQSVPACAYMARLHKTISGMHVHTWQDSTKQSVPACAYMARLHKTLSGMHGNQPYNGYNTTYSCSWQPKSNVNASGSSSTGILVKSGVNASLRPSALGIMWQP
jgi:hypothetical protein